VKRHHGVPAGGADMERSESRHFEDLTAGVFFIVTSFIISFSFQVQNGQLRMETIS